MYIEVSEHLFLLTSFYLLLSLTVLKKQTAGYKLLIFCLKNINLFSGLKNN